MNKEYEKILSKCTILLAEDDNNVRESFKRVLLLYVKDVIEASNGKEAYSIYKKKEIDIIITDVKMPKLNGLEFVKLVRKDDTKTPIIVTSAYTDQEYLLESIKLSLVEYLIKPIKSNDLNNVLEETAKYLLNSKDIVVELKDGATYNFSNKIFNYQSKDTLLTHKEVEFFELLLSKRGKLVTKEEIESKLYIYEEAPTSAIKNLVFKLRKKLKLPIIQTVGKMGYIIE